jgi:ribosomal protein S30
MRNRHSVFACVLESPVARRYSGTLVGRVGTVRSSDLCFTGKVHGSLARAGKVRGQTPKVEKQEKKKKRTGRAKRRMQYNRRFVNVVATFGRKRGPNSNADAGANKQMA